MSARLIIFKQLFKDYYKDVLEDLISPWKIRKNSLYWEPFYYFENKSNINLLISIKL